MSKNKNKKRYILASADTIKRILKTLHIFCYVVFIFYLKSIGIFWNTKFLVLMIIFIVFGVLSFAEGLLEENG